MFDPDFSYDYRDTAAFKAYVKQITAVIKKGRGVTVRQIKEALGDGYRVEWTADALEHLSDHLDTSFTIPTRYFWTDRPVRTVETTWNTRGDEPRKQARGQKARGRGFTL